MTKVIAAGKPFKTNPSPPKGGILCKPLGKKTLHHQHHSRKLQSFLTAMTAKLTVFKRYIARSFKLYGVRASSQRIFWLSTWYAGDSDNFSACRCMKVKYDCPSWKIFYIYKLYIYLLIIGTWSYNRHEHSASGLVTPRCSIGRLSCLALKSSPKMSTLHLPFNIACPRLE